MIGPRLLATSLLLALTGCVFGTSSSLVDEAGAEVWVVGLVGDERVTLELEDLSRAADADGRDTLTFYLALAPGPHEGTVRIDGDASRCAALVLDVDEGGADVAAVDARTAPLCAPAPDAGPDDAGPPDAGPPEEDAGPGDAGPAQRALELFVETEVVVLPCLNDDCDIVTIIESSGVVEVEELALAPASGTVSPADLDAFAAAALSPDADALFAGLDPSCPQGGALDGIVTLRRVWRGPDDTLRDETVDVSTCATGEAAALRARVALLRTLALE